MIIDLGAYINKELLVLAGPDLGKEVRKQCDIDRIDDDNTIKATIVIPSNIISLNSSFFRGLFSESVRKLGETGFNSKYTFECSEIIRKSIEEGIRRTLNRSTALG